MAEGRVETFVELEILNKILLLASGITIRQLNWETFLFNFPNISDLMELVPNGRWRSAIGVTYDHGVDLSALLATTGGSICLAHLWLCEFARYKCP